MHQLQAELQPPSVADSFADLFELHHREVLAFIGRRTSDSAVAEDVLGDTFTVAWRRYDEIPAEPLPWLYGVARRSLANRRRGEQRAEELATKIAAEPPSVGTDPSDLVIGRSTVLSAFSRLSEPERETLRLIAWDGLDAAEAAAVLGCSRTAFRVRVHRARKKLERELEIEDGSTGSGERSSSRTKECR